MKARVKPIPKRTCETQAKNKRFPIQKIFVDKLEKLVYYKVILGC